jgi:hypothetical protein
MIYFLGKLNAAHQTDAGSVTAEPAEQRPGINNMGLASPWQGERGRFLP